tara:strand:- start:6389 stop:7318 length:930 start_codon:yes stop_codon:yes gene_type:complete
MKIFVILLFIFSSNYSFSQELGPNYSWEKNDFYLQWPSRINQSDYFYRGQATNLTTFAQMLDMMTTPKSDSIVTSRLLRTLKSIYPEKSLTELLPLIDKQINWWREKKLIWKITYCHVDVYGCSMPTVRELMGSIFKVKMLPEEIRLVLNRQDSGGINYTSSSEMSEILSYFDPVVSTSFYKSVADKFGKDRGEFVGYVMILNDKNHRNCPFISKNKGNCFINHEEYLEEFEVPFWGYVLPREFEGFFVDDLKLVRIKHNQIRIEQGESNVMLDKEGGLGCNNLNNLNFDSNRKQLLFSSLKTEFGCKK